MIIKLPACYDTSYYEDILDFALVNPRPAFVCTKATEGSAIRDSKFLTYWADLKQDGIRRSCYHFHRKAVDAGLQATNFLNALKAGGVDAKDYLVLDIEEGGETAAQLIAWLDKVEAVYTNTIILYSTSYLFGELVKRCTYTQLTRLKRYPLWIAWYPYYPDDFTELPASYYPAGLGAVWLWQYSEKAVVQGITGNVDANWIAPVFRSILGSAPAPVTDVITTPHDGMEHISGTRNGRKFHLFTIDPRKFDMELASTPNLETVPGVAKRKGATLATNAGEWVRETFKPQDFTVSNGQGIVSRDKLAARPSFQIANGLPLVSHLNGVNVTQAFTGLRYLIFGGVIQAYLFGSGAEYQEGHARACFGLDAAGNVMILLSEGVYANQGLTLAQCAELLKHYGAVVAFDGGGGGDAGGVLNGQDLIKPENIVAGVNVYRALPMTFAVYKKEITMNGIAKEKFGSQTRVRKTPSRYGEVVRTLAGYAQVDFTEKVPAQISGTADKAGEIWLKLTDGNFVNFKLYNTLNLLTDLFSIIQEPSVTPPPAPSGDIALDMTLKADGSIVGTWTNV